MKKYIPFVKDVDAMFQDMRIDHVIETLQKIKSENSNIEDLSIDIDSGYSNISISVIGKRLETDEEYKIRIDKINLDKENSKKSRKSLYETLKKEFE